jgi:hypothetical protein
VNTTPDIKHLNSPNANVGEILKTLVLRLLIAQFRATGCYKSEQTIAKLKDRIEALGGQAPFLCVAKKRIAGCQDLVKTALELIPYLNGVMRPGTVIDARFLMPISCALADAYKVAASDAMLGTELTALQSTVATNAIVNADDGRTPDQIDQDVKAGKLKILSSMLLPVDTYIELLSVLPKLVLERTHMGTIWLEDHNRPGLPLRKLIADVNSIARLRPHLRGPQAAYFRIAMETAFAAIHERERQVMSNPTVRQQAKAQSSASHNGSVETSTDA